jgi:hypothetical protein
MSQSEDYFNKFFKELLEMIRIKSVEVTPHEIVLRVNWLDVKDTKLVREVEDSPT